MSSSCWLQRWPLILLLLFGPVGLFSQPVPVLSEGFPILLESGKYTSPRAGPNLADLNRDGKLEILVSSGRRVYAFQSNGTLLPGWPQTTTHETREPPAIGDLDNDGNLEVVTVDYSYDVDSAHTHESFLYAWTHDGNLLPNFPMALQDVFDPLTLYDLDNDGDLEIIGNFNTRVYVFHHDGTVANGWPQDIAPFYPIAKAAIGDIDADGQAEIVLPGQYAADHFEDYLGRLYVWRRNGEPLAGWPLTLPENYTFAAGSDAVLADVDLNGTLEIAVGTFKFIPPIARGFAALYRHDGNLMPGWPHFTVAADSLNGFLSGPAAGDLDNDGFPDLVFGDAFDHIAAWKNDGSTVDGWPVFLGEVDPTLVFRGFYANPSIGDIDGDKHFEILMSNNQGNLENGVVYGHIYAFNHDGTHLPWSPLHPRQSVFNNPVAMADLDSDGLLELVAVSSGRNRIDGPKETWLTVWQIPGVPYVKERFPWPMYGHDRWHTSQYGFEPPDEPTVRVEDRNQSGALPMEFALEQNHPNPFVLTAKAAGAFTEIRFALPQAAQVQIRLFDILGAEVKTWAMMKPAGVHQFRWNGRDNRGQPLPSGVYFYRLEAASAVTSISLTKKLLLMRQR
ncbi:MAG: FG-GAP-like repeat-containing protein [candidate division KSB1 bacterium]|nr:FG-GAP-like repeat-containing protein [candidate division KSB1 bacterium]MDZ7275528.1 FG-GAP-like repeat-containing protein [candidate division KSB1 bacterium]MDZ7286160.1 FG-GAP-like repeat-containing protein [candidate division KSB1 bacterium]MDZ7296386.1 FG-GAP-like repeat-containing protein [candidate division KSB1 bacterium]MDZ7306221.1 FG-GAP-like repeat-containing protein [candidate division KSB1 bacterium]